MFKKKKNNLDQVLDEASTYERNLLQIKKEEAYAFDYEPVVDKSKKKKVGRTRRVGLLGSACVLFLLLGVAAYALLGASQQEVEALPTVVVQQPTAEVTPLPASTSTPTATSTPTPRPTVFGVQAGDSFCPEGAAYCDVVLPNYCNSIRGWGKNAVYSEINVTENHHFWYTMKVEGIWAYDEGSKIWPYYRDNVEALERDFYTDGGRIDIFMCRQHQPAIELVKRLNKLEER